MMQTATPVSGLLAQLSVSKNYRNNTAKITAPLQNKIMSLTDHHAAREASFFKR